MRVVTRFLLTVLVAGFASWGALALYFAAPGAENLRLGLACGLLLIGLVAVFLLWGRRPLRAVALLVVPVLVISFWWASIEPSNDRDWSPDVDRLASISIDGDEVFIRNVRNFAWRNGTDAEPRWEERKVLLSQLDSLDLFAVYWMGDAIAHTILSFGFGGEQVAISIEIRKEANESYSALAGFFRRFELVYIVGDERDLIGGRALRDDPIEDIYAFRLKTSPERLRRLFLDYAVMINDLERGAMFYNTATTNCTTNILTHTRAYGKAAPLTWKVLLSGYFPEYVYEIGAMASRLPLAEIRAKGHINEKVRAVLDDPDFSARIRDDLPTATSVDRELGRAQRFTESVGDR